MKEAQHLEEKSEPVAVKQQDEAQEPAPGEQSEATSAAATPAPRKRRKKAPLPSVEEITPRPSYWPILLAFALCVAVMGLDIHPIVFVLGVLLVITAIIGWSVERR